MTTDYQYDIQGRLTCVLGPAHDAIGADGQSLLSVRTAQWTVYDDANSAVLTAQGYASGTNWVTLTLVNPVSIIQRDGDGQPLQTIVAHLERDRRGVLAADATSFLQSSYVRWNDEPIRHDDGLAGKHPRLSRHSRHRQQRGSSVSNYDETEFPPTGDHGLSRDPGGLVDRPVRGLGHWCEAVPRKTNLGS